ncbi:MAG: hypothetical protein JNL73_21580 [Anaerolineales bacterium]|nr:hypothetical protein [Anaerolineales bacterium]
MASQSFAHAIVRPPGPTFAQGLTRFDLDRPNLALARAQWEAYSRALETCGLTLTRLEPLTEFPDSTFVEDTAIVTARGAIVSRPGAPSRSGEVEAIRPALLAHFPDLAAIGAPGTLDGGDICDADGHFLIGISARTNPEGAAQLQAWLEARGDTAAAIDIRDRSDILHLKSGISYLGDNRLAVIPALADHQALRRFERVVTAPDEAYAANCVRVNERVLIAAGFPGFEARLTDLGYRPIVLMMSEFEKMDGGLSCLSLRIP